MAPPSNTRLALDTNIIYQLAQGVPHTEKFRLLCLERGYSLLVTPTVIEEATYRTRQATDDPKGAELAYAALTSLLSWGIQPFVLPPLDPVLITADGAHLLSIDRDALVLAYHDSHIGTPVSIFHPLTFIKAFGTLRKPRTNPKT